MKTRWGGVDRSARRAAARLLVEMLNDRIEVGVFAERATEILAASRARSEGLDPGGDPGVDPGLDPGLEAALALIAPIFYIDAAFDVEEDDEPIVDGHGGDESPYSGDILSRERPPLTPTERRDCAAALRFLRSDRPLDPVAENRTALQRLVFEVSWEHRHQEDGGMRGLLKVWRPWIAGAMLSGVILLEMVGATAWTGLWSGHPAGWRVMLALCLALFAGGVVTAFLHSVFSVHLPRRRRLAALGPFASWPVSNPAA